MSAPLIHFVTSDGPAPVAGKRQQTKKERRKKAQQRRASHAQAKESARPSITIKKGVVSVKKAARPAPAAEAPAEEDVSAAAPAEEEEAAPAAEEAEAPANRKKKVHAYTPAAEFSAFHLSAAELARPRGPAEPEAPVETRTSTAVSEKDAATALDRFRAIGFDETLARICATPKGDRGGLGLSRPTEVQALAAVALRARKDALIVAPTGSGKTLAYALPVLEALRACDPPLKRSDGAAALVLAPTRELCLQIADVVEVVARKYAVSVVPGAITGGESRKSEKARLRKGLSFLVATPGRLLDHLKSTACLSWERLEWVVFDEVDRLLDMGFGPQIDEVLRRLGRKTYVTALVTATITTKLQALASTHLGRDHALVEVRHKDLAEGAVETIAMPASLAQRYAICTLKLRLAALVAMLKDHPKAKTLVFVSTCASAEFHGDLFNRDGLRSVWEASSSSARAPRVVGRLHGKMNKDERKGAYVEFCADGGGAVLFATDVAARGLDFNAANVDWVVQLDAPRDAGTYAHRCGRAARAGKAGRALLLLLPSERPFLDALALRLRSGPPTRAALATKANFHDAAATAANSAAEALVAGDEDLATRARDAFAAHVRAYASTSFGRDSATDEAERDALHRAFHVRKIHLGHCAKAFGLKETPAKIAQRKRKDRERQGDNDDDAHLDKKQKRAQITKGGTKRSRDKKKQATFNKGHQSRSVGSTTAHLQGQAHDPKKRPLRASQVSEFGA